MKAFSRTLVRGKQSARLSCPARRKGALAPLPPIIFTNKVQKEKGDDTWQNQENETRL